MSRRDYQGPYYSLDDLRSVIDAMCKSIESSGLIDEHEHPSAYSALLDTSKWMAEMEGQEPVQYEARTRPDWRGEWYPWERCSKEQADDYRKTPRLHDWHYEVRELYARPVPAERPVNARLLDVATGKIPHLYEGRCPDYVNGPESRDPDCPACQAIVSADAQQERLLQDMHDAGREIDRMLSKPQPDAESIMTRDEVIRLAREAGFTWEPINNIAGPLESFAGLVAAAEREAWPDLTCVINWLESGCDPKDAAKELSLYQAAISARGQK